MKRQKKEYGSLSNNVSVKETKLERVLWIWYVIEAVLVVIVAIIASFVAYDVLKSSSYMVIVVIAIAYIVWLIIRTAQYRHDRIFTEMAEDIRVIRRTEELNADRRKTEKNAAKQLDSFQEEPVHVRDNLTSLTTEIERNESNRSIKHDELSSDQVELSYLIEETEHDNAVQMHTDHIHDGRQSLRNNITEDRIDSAVSIVKHRRHRDEATESESRTVSNQYVTDDKATVPQNNTVSKSEINDKVRRRRRGEHRKTDQERENESSMNKSVTINRRKRNY